MKHSLPLLLPLLAGLSLLACGDKDGDDTGDGGATGTDTDTDTDTTGPVDADGDGYDSTEDCDDANADISPGATEVCNDIDDDCDDLVDDADDSLDASSGETFYPDADGDGFGDGTAGVSACSAPADHVELGTDCDDANGAMFPGADELCNELDDDCDDEVDEDAVDGTTWYLDADEDGYGDASTGVAACDPIADRVEDGSDCDDADALVYPGAVELCDGLDNDCDSATTDAGTATWWGDDGEVSDLTAAMSGSARAPASVDFDSPGTATVCEGTWFVNTTIGDDVSIEGLGDSRASVVLDGADSSSVAIVQGAALDVSFSGLTMTGGYGSTGSYFYEAGGAVHCEDGSFESSLTFDDVSIEGNSADIYGGGVMSFGCDVVLTDVEFVDNDAGVLGGGMYAFAAGVVADSVEVYGNSALDVAGWYLYDGYVTEDIVLDDVAFYDNSPDSQVGGLGVAYAASLTWTGVAEGGSASIGHSDAGLGAALYIQYTAVDVDGVDFGEPGADDDNEPFDIYVSDIGARYNAGDDASFSCVQGDACGTSVDYEINDAEGTWYGYADHIQGITFDATSEDTLDGWRIPAWGDDGCSARFHLLGRGTAPTASGTYDYVVEWSSGTYSLSSRETWVGPDPRVTLEEGRSYGLVYECDCGGAGYCYTGRHDSTTTADDIGVGETTGFLYSSWAGDGIGLTFYPLDSGGDIHTTTVSVTAL